MTKACRTARYGTTRLWLRLVSCSETTHWWKARCSVDQDCTSTSSALCCATAAGTKERITISLRIAVYGIACKSRGDTDTPCRRSSSHDSARDLRRHFEPCSLI